MDVSTLYNGIANAHIYLSPMAPMTLISSGRKSFTLVAFVLRGDSAGQSPIEEAVKAETACTAAAIVAAIDQRMF